MLKFSEITNMNHQLNIAWTVCYRTKRRLVDNNHFWQWLAERLPQVSRVREVKISNPKVRPNLTQRCQTVRHHFNIYAGSCVALALWRGDGHRKLVTRFGVIRRV